MTAEEFDLSPLHVVGKGASVIVGIQGPRLSAEQGQRLVATARKALPDVDVLFVAGLTSVTTVGDTDLIVAATRMHDALFYQDEVLKNLPHDVAAAYGQLQDALTRRGWRS